MKTIRVGRNSDNDIVYYDMSVSGSHAEITLMDDGRVLITDHSTNGTLVNGSLLHHSTCQVSISDVIVFPGGNVLDWNNAHFRTDASYASNDVLRGYTVQQVDVNGDIHNAKVAVNNGLNKDLSFSLAFKEGMASGFKNILSLLVVILLTLLTFWVPYINVGVFIALTTLAPLWAKGEMVNPLEIFDSKYRRVMGDYIIVYSLTILCSALLLPFMVIPALVLQYSWMFAPSLVVYKGMDFSRAIKMSNQYTYGHKWTIFGLYLVFLFMFILVSVVLSLSIFLLTDGFDIESIYMYGLYDNIGYLIISSILMFLVGICFTSMFIGVTGSIWKQLCEAED